MENVPLKWVCFVVKIAGIWLKILQIFDVKKTAFLLLITIALYQKKAKKSLARLLFTNKYMPFAYK